jgi:ribosome maturation factor RimP
MDAEPLLEAVRRIVAGLGFELIEFRLTGPPQRPAIQLRIDRPDSRPGHGVTAQDCARASRAVERMLDASGSMGPQYSLQVSSPGLERPVRFPEHWRRYVGRVVRLTAKNLKGHPRAVIMGLPDAEHVHVRLPDGAETVVALADIKEALLEQDSVAEGRHEP